MTDDLNPQLGMNRRDLLKRGAIVGGTLVWAAPAVQTLAPKAFASTTGTPGCQNISNIALVVYNQGTQKYKYENGVGCTLEAGGNPDQQCRTAHPDHAANWDSITNTDSTPRASVNCSDPKTWVISPISNDYGIQWVMVKSGSQNFCKVYGSPTQAAAAKGQSLSVNTCP